MPANARRHDTAYKADHDADVDDAVRWLARVEEGLASRVQAEEPRVGGLARDLILSGGKRVRARLLFLSSLAVGDRPDRFVPLGSLVELLHAFTLVHDDIEDGASMRRGRPTLHAAWNTGIAVNAGDALYTSVWEQLLCLPLVADEKDTVQRLFAKACRQLVDGQGLELYWSATRCFETTEAEYVEMVERKTGALIRLACELGAISAPSDQRAALASYGRNLGVAYQIYDDILDWEGAANLTGKHPGQDMRSGRLSYPIIVALSRLEECRRGELLRALRAPGSLIESADRLRAAIMECGALAHARKAADMWMDRCTDRLKRLSPSCAADELRSLALALKRRAG
jgi:geranylgeranyl pyrophosphate synthase